MKKIVTLLLAAMAISTASTMQANDLRDQVTGLYEGSAQGGDYSTPPDYGWANLSFNYNADGVDPVTIVAGEADDQVVIKGFFPTNENFVDNGMVGTVVENSDYDGYLGYITLDTQVVGTFNGADVTLYNMSYSWALSTDTIELWITSDYQLSMGTYATLRYPGAEYDMYLYYVYASLSRYSDLPVEISEDDINLRNNLLGLYDGNAQGGDYSTPPDYGWANLQFSYNTEGYPAVQVVAGEAENEVIIKNFFPSNENFVDNGLVGKVISNTDYDGYLGYITLDTQVVGSFNDADVTLYNMSYSWALSTDTIELWITSDYQLSMGTYATLRYPGTEYDMYLYYVYAALSRYSDLPADVDPADAQLRNDILGQYEGDAQGGDYSTAPDYGWTALQYSYNTDEHPAVELVAGEADNEVVIKNIFPSNENFVDNGLVGKVISNTDYDGYLGYITLDTQTVGSFNGADVTLYNMSYSWALSTDTIELWISSEKAISMGCYLTLRYPGEQYDMYLYYVYTYLTPSAGQGGINAIAADVNNAPVEFFNINGMRVNAANLTPGLYIKRQGNEVSKVIIK